MWSPGVDAGGRPLRLRSQGSRGSARLRPRNPPRTPAPSTVAKTAGSSAAPTPATTSTASRSGVPTASIQGTARTRRHRPGATPGCGSSPAASPVSASDSPTAHSQGAAP
jgi:hypothetical protein